MHENYDDYSARRAGANRAPRPGERVRSDTRRSSASDQVERERRGATGRTRFIDDDDLSTSTSSRRASSRPVSHPSSRSNARPSHSGRIPAQRESGAAAARPRRAAAATAGGYGRDTYNAYDEQAIPATPASAATYRDRERYRRVAPQPKSGLRRYAGLFVSIGVVAAVALGIFFFIQSLPVSITLNGAPADVRGAKTLEDALKASGIKPKPGDLVAVDGSVLEAGKGEPFHATVNGTQVSELSTKLSAGDVVEIGNGGPIEEPCDSVEEAIPWEITEEGNGAIHLIEGEGTDGVKATKTGHISQITAQQITREPSHIKRRNVSPDTGSDKVIALTFDDGPWSDQTDKVLDVLAEHGAKATFFTVGDRIEQNDGASRIQRAASEGHQICTHSYDHASGSGQSVNLGFMKPEEQRAEIEKGYAAIEAVTGGEASRVIRTPGGNFGEDVVKNIGPLITAEIGWNIDSRDWEKPGADAIVEQLESAWSGAIILMHDGGGDRSQTVEALKIALPRLKEQGYKFVTIDELMKYPLA